MAKQSNSISRCYQNALLIIGIALITFSINEIRIVWTSKSDLIAVNGNVLDAQIFFTQVTDRRGHQSRKIQLIFYIENSIQKFVLTENKEAGQTSDKLMSLLHSLKRSKNITVWIEKSEESEAQPRVFEIGSGDKVLLGIEEVKQDHKLLTAFLLIMGLGSIVSFMWFRYPDKLKKVFE